jgi:hypothetical protein
MFLKSQKGSIIIPMITTVLVTISLVSYYYFEYYRLRRMGDVQLVYRANIVSHITTVKSVLSSQTGLIKTLKSALNSNLWDCVNNPEYDCNVSGEQPLTLITDEGSDLSPFSRGSASYGFDYDFKQCSTFPSNACPFRYELTWSAECPTIGVCNSPGIIVSGVVKMHSSFSKKMIINPENYKLMYRVR